jgi:ribosome biogenesis GTPase
MAGRKLNRRQQWRIKKIQEERLARVKNKQQKLSSEFEVEDETLYHGLVVSHYGTTLDIEPDEQIPLLVQSSCHSDENDRTIIRCSLRQNLGSIVCGDHIVWQIIVHSSATVYHPAREPSNNQNAYCPVQGVVTAVEPRQSVLVRPDFSGNMKAVAANIDQMLIVTSPVPEFNEGLIDRYLVAAELSRITPVLILNKIDTLNVTQRDLLEARIKIYIKIGYQVLYTSTKTQHGLTTLCQQLEGKTSVFVGQSGVGKSSLINALLPDINIKVTKISASTNKGRHTTSVSRLYHLKQYKLKDSRLIDSPGVREFGLWDISKEGVINGFRELLQYTEHCKFRDCKHLKEPGCGLLSAVQNGIISQQRLDSYHRIVDSL